MIAFETFKMSEGLPITQINMAERDGLMAFQF